MAGLIRRAAERADGRAAPGGVRGGRPGAGVDPGAAELLGLQRDAGNRAVTAMLAADRSRRPRSFLPVQRKPTARDRRRRARATKLKAADAKKLIGDSLPYALKAMSESQVDQIQKVFDASVVNPDVHAEAGAIDRKAVTAESGGLQNLDPDLVAKADRIREQNLVFVGQSDKQVRLDVDKLLTPDALAPRTDNPDEGVYLQRVRNTLNSKGVYLRVAPKLVKDPEDPSARIIDPRQFEAWLSLGPSGDTIPTKDGRIDRDALIGTTVLGAGYWENVDQGPVQAAIDREVKRLRDQIEMGMDQHRILSRIRDDAAPFVPEISDVLGGADFPDYSIWDQPNKLLLRAMEFNVGGNVNSSQPFLVVAAIATRNAARLLHDYIEDSSAGAERAVKVLRVAEKAGKVAEVGLAVTGVGLVAKGGRVVATEVAASEVDVAAEALVKRYAARNGIGADELAQVRYVPQPKGSIAGGVKPGTSSGAGTGFHKGW